MIRNLKALGLALVAVFAMSAVVASAAQATAGTLTAEGKPTVATGEQIGEHVFSLTSHLVLNQETGKLEPATTKCKKAHFDGQGTVTDGATTVTVTPTYTECKAFGLTATIDHNGCNYVFHVGTKNASGTWPVTTDVVCPVGKSIAITAATCEVTVGSQTGLVSSEATNSGGAGTAMDLVLHTKITGIHYVVTKDGIGCPLSGTGTFTDGDYTGTSTVKGVHSELGTAVGVTLH